MRNNVFIPRENMALRWMKNIEEDSYKFASYDTYLQVEKGYGVDIFIGEPKLWGKEIGEATISLIEEYLKIAQRLMFYVSTRSRIMTGHCVSGIKQVSSQWN